MSVTLSEVKRAAGARRAPLAGESAGYLVLALADQVSSAPRLIHANDVHLNEDGGLRVLRGQASSEVDAELSLRRALDGLLLVASSGSAALTRAGRRTAPIGLSAFVRELEAALIPVNRAAARRALARLHRETARALANGELEPEAAEPEDPLEPAIQLPIVVDLPPALPGFEETSAAPERATSDDAGQSDALTIALEVRMIGDPIENDDLLEEIECVEIRTPEPSEALTFAQDTCVASAPIPIPSEESSIELQSDACTRPEPVMLRRALRPLAQLHLPAFPLDQMARTPALGSLAAELPVLLPERIAELSRVHRDAQLAVVAPPGVECDAPSIDSLAEIEDAGGPAAATEEYTEPMPNVAPLVPGVALVASRRSEVSELLESFQVAPHDTNQGLCRAIKEMAELDLTPAPFAALSR